jgi:glycosyltransferase involved in cell wall biosynthesis
MLRVLFCSDHPAATSGYSVETALYARRLKEHCDLALLATYGQHGYVREWEGIPVYPGGADPFANDVIPRAAAHWKADIVITLKDSFVFNPQAFQGLRWMPMVPCDHDPVSPAVIDRARACHRPIAYAPHGLRTLRAAGLDPLYVPHAYGPEQFNPQPKAEARAFLGIPDDLFIVGTVAVNRGGIPSRKAWPQNLEAFALFAKDKPNARYFLHTDMAEDGLEGGIPLRPLAGQLGILDKIMFSDQERYRYGGFEPRYLHALYNAIDVLNAVSLGEGFGIPALEAQGCGTPVIVGDWCAHEDLCFGGWKVRKDEALHFYDSQLGWVYVPFQRAIADRLEKAHSWATDAPDTKEALQQHALRGAERYQIDRVIAEHWLPLLDEVERDIRTVRSRGVLRIVRPEEVLN